MTKNLYSGFDPITRVLLRFWRDRVVETGYFVETRSVLYSLDHRLLTDNVIVFLDHHYAFDALPLSLYLGKVLQNIEGALIPYAVHLDMGLDPEGHPSLRFRLRTWAFQKLRRNIQSANPTIKFSPIVREFEQNNPLLKKIVDADYNGINFDYLRTFVKLFNHHKSGQLCILSPTAGIAFPEKPILHPQTYRSMEIVYSRKKHEFPFYYMGAYPRLEAYYSYAAPLLTKHKIVAQGPFTLPMGSYDRAYEVVSSRIDQLREIAHFTPPDYNRIKHK